MKKSLILLSMIALLMLSAAFAYSDLNGENEIYRIPVDNLTNLGVLNGFPDGEFKPGNTVTKVEYAKMIVTLNGLSELAEGNVSVAPYDDVPTDYSYAGYIKVAKEHNLIYDDGTGYFNPEDDITYQEIFYSVLYNLGYKQELDESEQGYPTAGMLKAVDLELTDDLVGQIAGQGYATRGNIAIIFWNALRTQVKGQNYLLINQLFPDAYYFDNYYIDSVEVQDYDNVLVYFSDGYGSEITAYAEDVDLTQLLENEKVDIFTYGFKNDLKVIREYIQRIKLYQAL